MKTLLQLFPLPAPEFTFAGFTFPRHVSVLPRGSRAERIERHTKPLTGPYYISPEPLVGGKQGKSFYLKSDFAPGLRWKWADEASPHINHTGWYCDNSCDQKIRGIVLRLPSGRGFLSGWSMGEGWASGIDTTHVFLREVHAAQYADGLADDCAENERNYREMDTGDEEDLAA